ncbi:DUF6615 family protein [Sphingomonas fuzhouensis]|uniref:DUF6615 family protein n=1 Tax=Sphingomonas fuzhouensis TaxID=3106033 RepID=UPI0035C91767
MSWSRGCSMTITLCDSATRLPLLVGRLLDREAKLKRGRFRELRQRSRRNPGQRPEASGT